MNRSIWLVEHTGPMCQQWAPGAGGAGGDASAAMQNSSIMPAVTSAYNMWWYREKELRATYVTAYCANERYSTSTSRPLFSSFKNSLTHLRRDGQRWVSTQTLIQISERVFFKRCKRSIILGSAVRNTNRFYNTSLSSVWEPQLNMLWLTEEFDIILSVIWKQRPTHT